MEEHIALDTTSLGRSKAGAGRLNAEAVLDGDNSDLVDILGRERQHEEKCSTHDADEHFGSADASSHKQVTRCQRGSVMYPVLSHENEETTVAPRMAVRLENECLSLAG